MLHALKSSQVLVLKYFVGGSLVLVLIIDNINLIIDNINLIDNIIIYDDKFKLSSYFM